jgi:dynein heavy chain
VQRLTVAVVAAAVQTETVKELGKALGKYVLVFNCGPHEDVGSVGENPAFSPCVLIVAVHCAGSRLAGLVQTGAWGCFDEFNR